MSCWDCLDNFDLLTYSIWPMTLFDFQKFNVKEQEVHNALLAGDPHDQLRIAYYLIIDNKRIMDESK